MLASHRPSPPFPGLRWFLVLASLCLIPLEALEAQNRRRSEAQRRRDQSRAIGRQRALLSSAMKAVETKLAAARAAYEKAEYTAALGHARAASASFRIDNVLREIDDAKLQAEMTTARLQAAEARIEAEQGNDSDLAVAEADFEAAKQALERARIQALSSPAYQARYREALASLNKATLLPQVRREALEQDAAFQAALREYKRAEYVLGRIKIDLFHADEEWQAAAQAARDVRWEQAEARDNLIGGMTHRLAGRVTAIQSEAAKAHVGAVIARQEEMLKSLRRQHDSLGRRKQRLDSYGSPGSNR